MMLDVVYERRGDFDASRLKDALAFTVNGKRVALFKHHERTNIGIAVTLPNGGAGCFEMPCDKFFEMFEAEWNRLTKEQS